ncbi:MAG: hypothetical protein COY42_23425 [Armatimonadetes bacterium CG_4_10_14_0_8_um_filter_66_14]|nr:MAG: hypothetical protein COY42_23425 [Armatimonadetes bacterium CG_4_10_14_0_8_um_filter_66_14]
MGTVLLAAGCGTRQAAPTRDEALRRHAELAAAAARAGDDELATREYQSLLVFLEKSVQAQGREALDKPKDLASVRKAVQAHQELARRFETHRKHQLAAAEHETVLTLLDLSSTRERQNAVLAPGDADSERAVAKRLSALRSDRAETLEKLAKALERTGDKIGAAYRLGAAYQERAALRLEAGDPEGAEACLRQWADAAPTDPAPRWALAQSLTNRKQFREAAEQYGWLVKRAPADLDTRRRLAETLRDAGKVKEAAVEYRALVTQLRQRLAAAQRRAPNGPESQLWQREAAARSAELADLLKRAADARGTADSKPAQPTPR